MASKRKEAKASKRHQNRYQKIAAKISGETPVPENTKGAGYSPRGRAGLSANMDIPAADRIVRDKQAPAPAPAPAPAAKTLPKVGDKWVGGGNWGYKALEGGGVEVKNNKTGDAISLEAGHKYTQMIFDEFANPLNDFSIGEEHDTSKYRGPRTSAPKEGGEAFAAAFKQEEPAEAVSSDSVWANSTNVPNRYQQAANAAIAEDDEQYQRNAAESAPPTTPSYGTSEAPAPAPAPAPVEAPDAPAEDVEDKKRMVKFLQQDQEYTYEQRKAAADFVESLGGEVPEGGWEPTDTMLADVPGQTNSIADKIGQFIRYTPGKAGSQYSAHQLKMGRAFAASLRPEAEPPPTSDPAEYTPPPTSDPAATEPERSAGYRELIDLGLDNESETPLDPVPDSVWANSTNVPNRYQQAANAAIAKDDEQYQRNAAGSATFPGAPPEADRQSYYPGSGEAYFLTKEGTPDLARQKVYDDYEEMLEYSRANGLPVPKADLNE